MFRQILIAGCCLGAAIASSESEDTAAAVDIAPVASATATAAGLAGHDDEESTVFTTSQIARSSVTTNAVPTSNCQFDVEPATPHAWDPKCVEPLEDTTGCLADGIHKECRYCGVEGFPPCPTCEFQGHPATPFTWDKNCKPGGYTKGCFADGRHFECRWCGDEDGIFDPCPFSSTTAVSTTDVATTSVAHVGSTSPPASSSTTGSPPASSAFSEVDGSSHHTSASPLVHDMEATSTTFLQEIAAAPPSIAWPSLVLALAAGTLLRHG